MSDLTDSLPPNQKSDRLAVYLLITFGIATPIFLLYSLVRSVSLQLVLLVAGSYAPTVAAQWITRLERNPQSSQAFFQRLRTWRVGTGWYLVVLLLPSVTWLLAAGGAWMFGAGPSLQPAAFAGLPVIFIANLGEEIGWRGFALPRLLERYSPLTASLVLGLIWGVFHLPVYRTRPLFAGLTLLLLLSVSVLLTWLFIQTHGSVLLCTLFHAVLNTWGQAFLASPNSDGLYAGVIALMWVAAAGLVLRYGPNLADPGKTPLPVYNTEGHSD